MKELIICMHSAISLSKLIYLSCFSSIFMRQSCRDGPKKFMTTGKSDQSGDDRGELKGKRKVNVWISPTMPGRNGQTASWHISGSESPSKKHRVLSGTSNSNVSPRPNWHNFSASRFSNTWSHFGRTW